MDRHETSPFMLQLFYRTNAFHRPDEFTTTPLPPHLTLHTWSNCTLAELSHHIAASDTSILPNPAIGTRLAFRLIFADTRGGRGSSSSASGHHHHHHHHAAPSATPRYMVKELGSIVIGDGGPGLDAADDADAAGMPDIDLDHDGDVDHNHGHNGHDNNNNNSNNHNNNNNSNNNSSRDADKTLAEARFVAGDYVSCAILPPLPDGSVAPASSTRTGRGAGAGESRVAVGRAPGIGGGGSGGGGIGMRDRENGYGFGFGRHGRGRVGGGRGGGGGGGGAGVGVGASSVPMGEWRRGERLPDMPPSSRGRSGRGRY